MNKVPWIHALAFYKRVWRDESKVNLKQSKPSQENNQSPKAMQGQRMKTSTCYTSFFTFYKQKCKTTVPSVVIFLDCPDVVVNLNPAGNVSEDPGIMLIPCTSRGGNCLLQVDPRLKFLSSLCQYRVRNM